MAKIICTTKKKLGMNQVTILLDYDDTIILDGVVMHSQDAPSKTGHVLNGDTNIIILNTKEEI